MAFRPVVLVLFFLLRCFFFGVLSLLDDDNAGENRRERYRRQRKTAKKAKKDTTDGKQDSEKRRNHKHTPINLLPSHSYSPCRYFESLKTYVERQKKKEIPTTRRQINICIDESRIPKFRRLECFE